MLCFRKFLVVVALLTSATSEQQKGLCKLPYCVCEPALHPSWTRVNCTIPKNQKLNIYEGDIPISTTDFIVTGAEAVMFGANSLSKLTDIRHVQISRSNLIVMRKFAAIDIDVISMYLFVDNCNVLRLEEQTFSNIKGPLSVTIMNCDYVSFEGEAFSWLLNMNISHVRNLYLGPGSFTLDPKAANVGKHGPGLTIELTNLTIPEIGGQTFGSSAAAITMVSVVVRAIRSGAFSANTYSVLAAINSTFELIQGESFTQNTLITNLRFDKCDIQKLESRALESAVAYLNITNCRFEDIEPGAINATIATVAIMDSEFNNFQERGFKLSSWNKLQMERNKFIDFAPNAIIATGASIHELVFVENEIEKLYPESLRFIGDARTQAADNIKYESNYFGQSCHCNLTYWLSNILGFSGEPYLSQSYCTVDEFFARCFNVPEQNMLMNRFLRSVCSDDASIICEPFKAKNKGEKIEIQNTKFPLKKKDRVGDGLSMRDKKIIGIVVLVVLSWVIVLTIISFTKWARTNGFCTRFKNCVASLPICRVLCDSPCCSGLNSGMDNAHSISQLSINEYSERHRLHEQRVQEIVQTAMAPEIYTEAIVTMENKFTQTLPEELTKELLENLRERLEDPEDCAEAREIIEHLYELIKVEENCNNNAWTHHETNNAEENIYELPFQNTIPRIGKNQKEMRSVGTKVPSLDKLWPLSPYNRQTALAHEYFEPKDFAVHLYAEIANCDKDKKTFLTAIPDVLADQAGPRGPYLRAVCEKMNSSTSSSPSRGTYDDYNLFNSPETSPPSKPFSSPQASMSTKPFTSTPTSPSDKSINSPLHLSSIKSNKSTDSNSSGKMLNRPLPAKPN